MPRNGLSPIGRQAMNMNVPPGFSARRTLRIAATGLAKNIVPKREKAKSNPGVNGYVSTSATTKRTLSSPAAFASSRPFCKNASQQSRASTADRAQDVKAPDGPPRGDPGGQRGFRFVGALGGGA